MTAQDTNLMRSPKWGNIKEEYDERQLTHTCFRCSARYATSSMLVQHMKEEHSSFVTQPATRTEITIENDKPTTQVHSDRYTNSIAKCPFCKRDCQTRKKLMRHLEQEHKDDNEQEDEQPSNVKFIRIDDEQHKLKLLEQLSKNQNMTGPFVTPGATDSSMVQKLLKEIGASGSTLSNGNARAENKNAAKSQYKCFWCDASFRKRGKLMDHIDTLHKHNKQQNQAEAEMLSMDDPNKPLHSRQLNHRNASLVSQLELPSYMPGISYTTSNHSLPRRSPQVSSAMVENKVAPQNSSKCSFTLAGSLTNKPKSLPSQEPTSPNTCIFYLRKKDNPLANITPNTKLDLRTQDSNQRRFSFPNIFDAASSSPSYNFPYRMLPSNSMAAAMQVQHNYMMNIRPPLINATQFYAPRLPMMMPNSDYLVNHAHPILEHHTQNSQAQLFARINAMAQMSPLARPKATESPLDLTKPYV